MRLHRKIPQMFGYDLIHLKRHQPTIESHLKVLLNNLDINVVFDVGANVGQFGSLLRQIGYKGDILSFEPVSKNHEELERQSFDDPKWKTYNYALGSENKNMEINVTNVTTFSSFLDPNKYAESIFAQKVPITQKETVEIKKLDDVFADITSSLLYERQNIFLKMDTQGYDLQVFAGAKKVITQITALLAEISLIPLYEGMPDFIETISEYRKEGFEITGLYPVTRDHDTMCLVEMDCVMKRV